MNQQQPVCNPNFSACLLSKVLYYIQFCFTEDKLIFQRFAQLAMSFRVGLLFTMKVTTKYLTVGLFMSVAAHLTQLFSQISSQNNDLVMIQAACSREVQGNAVFGSIYVRLYVQHYLTCVLKNGQKMSRNVNEEHLGK